MKKLKIGTFSENILFKSPKYKPLRISDKAGKTHDQIMELINQLARETHMQWGVIHEPWFETVNAMSFALGFGACMATVVADRILVGVIRRHFEKKLEKQLKSDTDDKES